MRVSGFIVMRSCKWEDSSSTAVAVVTDKGDIKAIIREDAIRIINEGLDEFDEDDGYAASIAARYHVVGVS